EGPIECAIRQIADQREIVAVEGVLRTAPYYNLVIGLDNDSGREIVDHVDRGGDNPAAAERRIERAIGGVARQRDLVVRREPSPPRRAGHRGTRRPFRPRAARPYTKERGGSSDRWQPESLCPRRSRRSYQDSRVRRHQWRRAALRTAEGRSRRAEPLSESLT